MAFLAECYICPFCYICTSLYVGSLEISDIAEQCCTAAPPKPRPTTHSTGVQQIGIAKGGCSNHHFHRNLLFVMSNIIKEFTQKVFGDGAPCTMSILVN